MRTLSLTSSSQTGLSYDYFLNSTEIVNLTSFKFYNFYWWTKDHSFIYSPFFNNPVCYLVLVCHKGLHWPVPLSYTFPKHPTLNYKPPPPPPPKFQPPTIKPGCNWTWPAWLTDQSFYLTTLPKHPTLSYKEEGKFCFVRDFWWKGPGKQILLFDVT